MHRWFTILNDTKPSKKNTEDLREYIFKISLHFFHTLIKAVDEDH